MTTERGPESLPSLRARAEEQLKERMDRLKELSTRDVRDLVHELGTHQIELEMQNEELRRAQEELEASRSRFAELYDFAPIGYFTLDAHGVVREVNLTGAHMLGIERRSLVKKPFAGFIEATADKELFHRHCTEVLQGQVRLTCELGLKTKAGTKFFALLESIAVRDPGDGAVSLRTVVSDITGRKLAEDERERLIRERMDALSKVKTLSGLLPICMHCKKIRDDEGYWNQLEAYVSKHSEAEFSHGLCPECAKELYPRYFKNDEEK